MPRVNRYSMPNYVWHITHRYHKKEFLLRFVCDRRHWQHGEIAKSMQLIAGRTAQEYNRRKTRQGAFWEDRFHTTLVDTNNDLARCMTYIDLNMIRAGVVPYPGEWLTSGYHEIQNPPVRYTVIDPLTLLDIFGFTNSAQLRQACREWVEETPFFRNPSLKVISECSLDNQLSASYFILRAKLK